MTQTLISDHHQAFGIAQSITHEHIMDEIIKHVRDNKFVVKILFQDITSKELIGHINKDRNTQKILDNLRSYNGVTSVSDFTLLQSTPSMYGRYLDLGYGILIRLDENCVRGFKSPIGQRIFDKASEAFGKSAHSTGLPLSRRDLRALKYELDQEYFDGLTDHIRDTIDNARLKATQDGLKSSTLDVNIKLGQNVLAYLPNSRVTRYRRLCSFAFGKHSGTFLNKSLCNMMEKEDDILSSSISRKKEIFGTWDDVSTSFYLNLKVLRIPNEATLKSALKMQLA